MIYFHHLYYQIAFQANVVYRDSVIWSTNLGRMTVNSSSSKLKPDAIFPVASLSKVVTVSNKLANKLLKMQYKKSLPMLVHKMYIKRLNISSYWNYT